MRQYFWNLLLIIDQAVNTVFGPVLNFILKPTIARFGDPSETLSSVFGKNIAQGQCTGCKFICKILNWFQPNHCIDSIEPNEGKRSD